MTIESNVHHLPGHGRKFTDSTRDQKIGGDSDYGIKIYHRVPVQSVNIFGDRIGYNSTNTLEPESWNLTKGC